MEITVSKAERLLQIYSRLVDGETLHKDELAQQFHVTERSVQRDMESLRCFFADQGIRQDVVYDRIKKGYCLERQEHPTLSNSEILAVCKILLDSRSLRKDEMLPVLDRMISCCVPEENKQAVMALIANETHHYIEPHHEKHLLPVLWELGKAINEHRVIEITYERMKEPKLVRRVVEPVGIMFSEYYFYLTAFLRNVDKKAEFDHEDDLFPTIYRVDRIQSCTPLDEKFDVPYAQRFEEGEFRKRVQFMYGGKLQTVRFKYTGPSVEAVLDRLPTAKIVAQDDEGWTIQAEVFGSGIDMWLRSQGDYIRRL